MDPSVKKIASDILLDPNDAMALQHGIAVVIKNELLRIDSYAAKLEEVCDSTELSRLSLSLKGLGLSGPVPRVLLRICAEAEFFDLSGNFEFQCEPGKGGGKEGRFMSTTSTAEGQSDDGDSNSDGASEESSSSSSSSSSDDESDAEGGTISYLQHLVGHVHNMKAVTLVDMRSHEDLADLDGMQYYRTVETCEFGKCIGLKDVSALGGCASLTRLDLHECEQVEDITALGQCTALTSLDLSSCDSIENISALRKCTRLASLVMYESKGIDSLSALEACVSLTRLDLHGCSAVVDVAPLRTCTALTELNLSRCNEDLKDITALGALTSLTQLQLWGLIGLREVPVLGGLTALTSLQLGRCKRVKDITALGGCKALAALQLEDCKGIRDISVLGKCRALTQLNLRGCEWITDISALSSCLGLTNLDLGESTRRLSGVSEEQVRKALAQTSAAQERAEAAEEWYAGTQSTAAAALEALTR
jgi:Leucine-rich repeat (LRR) protein